MKRNNCYWLTLFLCSAFGNELSAAEGGYSHYIPGTYGDFGIGLAPTTEFTIRNDVYYYNADIEKSVRNGRVELDTELSMVLNLTTVIYNPEIEIAGAKYITGTVLPLIYSDIDTNVNSMGSSADVKGLSDVTLIPGALLWNDGNFHFSLAEYIIAPSGGYDVGASLNEGVNYWTFEAVSSNNRNLTYGE